MHDFKLSTRARAHHRVSDYVSRLNVFLLSSIVALAPAHVYAIDPVTTGAWAAYDLATSVALGGAGGAAGAAEGAAVAVGASASAAAAAAAVAAAAIGFGVASFCLTSYLRGNNACGGGATNMTSGLGASAIFVDPASGELVKDVSAAYFIVNALPTSPAIRFADAASACSAYVSFYNKKFIAQSSSLRITLTSSSESAAPNLGVGWGYLSCSGVEKSISDAKYMRSFTDTSAGYKHPPERTLIRPAPADLGAAVANNSPARAAAAAAAAASAAGGDLAAQQAAAAAAVPNVNTDAYNCANKGMMSGQFNGATICVPVIGDTDLQGQTGTGDSTAGTNTGTGTTTGTTTPSADTKTSETPAFCVYATTVCTWIGWTQVLPDSVTTSTKVDIKSVDTAESALSGIDIDQQRIVFNNQCPPDIPMSFTMFGQSASYAFSYDPLCQFMTKLRPFVIAAAYMTGAYIIAGTGRGSNDG